MAGLEGLLRLGASIFGSVRVVMVWWKTDDLLGTPRLQDGHYLPPQARRPL